MKLMSTCSDNFTQHLECIHTKMYDSPGHYYILDQNRNFLYANKEQVEHLQLTNFPTRQEQNLAGTINERFEPLCSINDQIILKTQKPHTFTECFIDHHNKFTVLTSYKRPYYYKDKLVGIEGLSLEVNLNSFSSPNNLTNLTLFIDTGSGQIIHLSKSQRRVLFHALKGLKAESIAEILNLSKRTVQNHLATIKDASEYSSLKELLIHTIVL